MYAWQVNPNTPTLAAMRTARELLARSEVSDDDDAARALQLTGQMLTLLNCFAQLSLSLDNDVQYSLGTPQTAEALLSALLATEIPITSISDQLKALAITSTQSQWILKNRKALFHFAVAAEDFMDEGFDYHEVE